MLCAFVRHYNISLRLMLHLYYRGTKNFTYFFLL